jgi:peptide/nickel transport system ATP-binding protein
LREALSDVEQHHGANPPERHALMDALGIDAALLERKPAQVSGGELQRIALARVFLARPALLFADEATSRLDPITQQLAMRLMVDQCRAREIALMVVSHDAALAAAVAGDRVIRVGAS